MLKKLKNLLLKGLRLLDPVKKYLAIVLKGLKHLNALHDRLKREEKKNKGKK
jgi:hypothetical protein